MADSTVTYLADTVTNSSNLMDTLHVGSYRLAMYSLNACTCALALIINPVTLVIIIRFPILRSSVTNVFIASLSASDILYGLTLWGSHNLGLVRSLGYIHISHGMIVRLAIASNIMAFFSSLICTTWIGVDRAIATLDPLNYKRRMTRRMASGMVLSTWLYLFILIPGLTLLKYLTDDDDTRSIVILIAQDAFPRKIYDYVIAPHIYLFVLTNVALYATILIAVLRRAKKVNISSNEKRNNHLTKMILTLVVLQVLALVPMATVIIIPVPDPVDRPTANAIYKVVYDVSILITASNSFTNAFVYAWQHRDYRNAYLQLLCKSRTNEIIPYESDPRAT